MKNAITLIFLLVILLSNCAEEPIPTNNPIQQDSELKYFGFAFIDAGWDDPLDFPSEKDNYLDEVSPFSNIADILVSDSVLTYHDRLIEMYNNNMKAYMNVFHLFFEEVGTDAPSGRQFALRSNYEERWTGFISNNYLLYGNAIQAFYLGDEPTWNGISYEDLEEAASRIQNTTPDVPIIVIENHLALDDLQIPTTVDWVGFNRYFVKDPVNDPDYQNDLSLLKSKITANYQRLVILMDSHYITEYHNNLGGISVDEMTEVATNYYELAKSESKAIALIGYSWPGGFRDESALGARHMLPETLVEYERIGREITGK